MADRAGRANGRAMSADDAGVDIAQTDRVAGFGLSHDPGRANLDAFSASDAAGGVDIYCRCSQSWFERQREIFGICTGETVSEPYLRTGELRSGPCSLRSWIVRSRYGFRV